MPDGRHFRVEPTPCNHTFASASSPSQLYLAMEFILPKRIGASGHVLKQISATPGSTGGWLDLSRHYWCLNPLAHTCAAVGEIVDAAATGTSPVWCAIA